MTTRHHSVPRATHIRFTTEDGEGEAHRTEVDRPWCVMHPRGAFRLYGGPQEVIRRLEEIYGTIDRHTVTRRSGVSYLTEQH